MEIEFRHFPCSACGVYFGIPSDYVVQLRETGRTVYCPNGHQNVFPKPQQKVDQAKTDKELNETRAENVRLKEDIVRLRHELEMLEARRAV